MWRYILSITIFIIFLIFTLLNIIGEQTYVSLNFIFFNTPSIPGIMLLYIGMIIGSLLTIPIIILQRKKAESKVLNLHMKNEQKRMKKIKKQEQATPNINTKIGNVNSKVTKPEKKSPPSSKIKDETE